MMHCGTDRPVIRSATVLKQPAAKKSRPAAARKPPKSSKVNRRDDLLRVAGQLMASKGYEGSSMRDIAASVGMLPGSVYYHFPSKEALFVELHRSIVDQMMQKLLAALDGLEQPWDRLEAAACAHIEGLIATGNLVAIVSPEFLDEQSDIAGIIREERRAYEQKFRDLFEDLDLPAGADASLLRLGLFGALNWVTVWFKPDGRYPSVEIARQYVHMMRLAYGR
jgi:AcrR family transcriptional regulator